MHALCASPLQHRTFQTSANTILPDVSMEKEELSPRQLAAQGSCQEGSKITARARLTITGSQRAKAPLLF